MKQTIEIEVPDGKKAIWKDGTIIFEDIKLYLPKTWEEFCKQNPIKKTEKYIDANSEIDTAIIRPVKRVPERDKNLLPSKDAAEAHLALIQLHQLRDCYRQGWVPDYSNYFNKFCITSYFNFYSYKYNYKIISHTKFPCFLSFQSKEIAEEFLNNFKDLIEQAGDLI